MCGITVLKATSCYRVSLISVSHVRSVARGKTVNWHGCFSFSYIHVLHIKRNCAAKARLLLAPTWSTPQANFCPILKSHPNLCWWFTHSPMCSLPAGFGIFPMHNSHGTLLLTDMCCNLFENKHLQHVRASKLRVSEVWKKKWHRKKYSAKKNLP